MAYSEEKKKEIFDKICFHIENQSSVKEGCDKEGISKSTFYKWIDDDSSKANRYVRACEERASFIFEEIIEIADDTTKDTYIDDNGRERTDHEAIQRSKLKIDARKWMLSKMNPSKYGDKIQVESKDTKPTPLLKYSKNDSE